MEIRETEKYQASRINFAILLVFVCFYTISGYPQANRKRAVVDSLNEQSWGLRNSYPDQALALAKKSDRLSREINYKKGLGDSFSRQGVILFKKGNLEEASQMFNQSLEVRSALSDSLGMADCMTNLSNVYRDLGNLDKALNLTIKGLRIRTAFKDSNAILSSQITLGNLFREKGDLIEANSYYLQALGLSRRLKNAEQQSLALNNIGLVYYEQQEMDSALVYFTKSLTLEKTLQNTNGIAESYNNIALVHWNKNDWTSAIEFFDSSLFLHKQLNTQDAIAATLSNRGEVFLEMRDFKRAQADFGEGLAIISQTGEAGIYKHLLYNQYRLYHILGDYERALTNHIRFYKVDSVLRNKSMDKNFKDIWIKYETEKKERENTELRAQNAEQQIDINRKRQIMWMLALALAVIALAGGFLVYRQRQKTIIAQKNEELKQHQIDELLQKQELASINAMMEGQEQERQRIAQDLHDRIGSQLAAVKLNMEALEDKVDKGQSENKGHFSKTYGMLDELVDEVRKISHNMVSGVLMKFGLEVALRDLAASISTSGRIRVDVHTYNLHDRIAGKIELAVYRIIQELLANVLKHAQAQHITISLNRQDGNLNVMVEDDGRGFDPDKVKRGMGLQNIQQRAEAFNGTVNIDAKSGRGTTVIVDIPLT